MNSYRVYALKKPIAGVGPTTWPATPKPTRGRAFMSTNTNQHPLADLRRPCHAQPTRPGLFVPAAMKPKTVRPPQLRCCRRRRPASLHFFRWASVGAEAALGRFWPPRDFVLGFGLLDLDLGFALATRALAFSAKALVSFEARAAVAAATSAAIAGVPVGGATGGSDCKSCS